MANHLADIFWNIVLMRLLDTFLKERCKVSLFFSNEQIIAQNLYSLT